MNKVFCAFKYKTYEHYQINKHNVDANLDAPDNAISLLSSVKYSINF